MSIWKKIKIKPDELRLETTLQAGQAFRWKYSEEGWSCAFNHIILSLKQDASYIYYRVLVSKPDLLPCEDEYLEFLKNYFNLSVSLSDLYKEWALRDTYFKHQMECYKGIRILRQDPWENLICFICSSNNNIRRITRMVDKLCSTYGSFVGTLGKTDYFNFPTPARLSEASVESKLRELGFGYRAKFIWKTAWLIENERPKKWLESLRNQPYNEAKKNLCELIGVGYKVADCVCLMSLDKPFAVPIDTHVWQIAQKNYNFKLKKHKTLSKMLYDTIGDYFRNLWGNYAGWAQNVLFTSDLLEFKNRTIEMEQGLPRNIFKNEVDCQNKISDNDKS
ncbi:hypothetical protein PCK2_000720 [Pneumocystis canis]|nr:hypothetical protein PCK2_000720 [Pneumocystis canis]